MNNPDKSVVELIGNVSNTFKTRKRYILCLLTFEIYLFGITNDVGIDLVAILPPFLQTAMQCDRRNHAYLYQRLFIPRRLLLIYQYYMELKTEIMASRIFTGQNMALAEYGFDLKYLFCTNLQGMNFPKNVAPVIDTCSTFSIDNLNGFPRFLLAPNLLNVWP